jgi:anionic cell wall polymer biosynthesis LytR-Cps2A-Psr (LCP) family protein
MRYQRQNKKKIILSVVIAVMLIAMFGMVLHLIEKHGLKDSQFGDKGDWGETGADPIYLLFNEKDYVSYDDIDTFLVAGTDGGGVDMGEGMNGDLADFIMILLIDNTTKRYGFYQIDRNSMCEVSIISENGSFSDYVTQQLCTAHWYGMNDDERNENLVTSTSMLVGGLPLDKYYVMNMKDIGTVNNAIGGVTVTIPTDMTAVDPAFVKDATVHLTDKQAEEFVRARMALDDDTNAARMSRQTQYMQNAYSMVISQLRENPEYINDIYQGLEGVFQTNGTGKDISNVTNEMIQFENAGILTFDGEVRDHDTLGDGEIHEEFFVNEESMLTELRKVMNIEEDTGEDSDDEGEDYGMDDDVDLIDPDSDEGLDFGDVEE